jgi:Flp pilus assembly protein TadG
MLNRSSSKGYASVTPRRQQAGKRRFSHGQSAVEFAMISVLALVVMLVGIQFALIGQAALAVSQGASAIARYAAVNGSTLGSSYGPAAPNSAMQNLLSSSIVTGSGGSDLQVTVTTISAATGKSTTTPVALTDSVQVNLSYTATSKIFLPSNTLLGITFPTTLAASDTQLYE